LGVKYIQKVRLQKKLDRWMDTPKDLVILHGVPFGKTVANPSPFVLKALTYLRMTGIKYVVDTKDYGGPKGKAPWISINGIHIGDSQLVVEYLMKKFEKKLHSSYTEEQLAVSTAIRVMLEERSFWGIAMDRFLHSKIVSKVFKGNWRFHLLFHNIGGFILRRRSYAHGIGLHTEKEIVEFIKSDMRTVSQILGNKKYILGDEPCENDCAIFGIMAQFVWGLPGSPYEKFLHEELTNVKEYCIRIKEKYYPDWDEIITKANYRK